MLTSIGLLGMQSFLSYGSMYTIMSHANLFSSLCALIIICWRIAVFRTATIITKWEVIGSLVALAGCVVTTFDGDASKVIES